MKITVIKSKKRKRSMSSRLEGDTLVIRVPQVSSQQSIDDFVNKSTEWASKRVEKFESYSVKEGEIIPILGIDFKIKSIKQGNRNSVKVSENNLEIIYIKSPVDSLIKHLKKRLVEYISVASYDYAKEIGEKFNRITIKKVSTIWGSCSGKQNLNYNFRLALAPLWITDYVAAHEVCHLKHKNHSKRFWNLVEQVYPNYKSAKTWLNKNGNKLHLSQ